MASLHLFWQKHYHSLLRGLLLSLILLAFARVLWQLDAKALWWDESLSLQRAEEGWLDLLRGRLIVQDGFTVVPTTDQHPFFFFLLEGILIRLVGSSEFVLRFPSVLAATLLVPTIWLLGSFLKRQTIVPASTPYWAAFLAAVNPFFLWYGQEARPYALWAWLALLSTYLLLRCTTTQGPVRLWLLGYLLSLLFFLTTHYYAVFLLPVHTLLFYFWLAPRNRWLALGVVSTLLGLGLLIGVAVAWVVFSQGGGVNFPSISLAILLPDLLNAFSLGKSVDIDDVRWLDYIFGAIAIGGIGWGLRSQRVIRNGGWLLPSLLVVPISILLLVNRVQPGYMDARHLNLIGGAFILLVGAGLGLLWHYQKWAAGALALLLSSGIAYSTVNYFTLPLYDKDDYRGMAEYLNANLLPGDLVLISPPFSWRIFSYYLPLNKLDAGKQAALPTGHYGMPLLRASWHQTYDQLAQLSGQYRRIWLARSGTHPYLDPEGKVGDWLKAHSARQLEVKKFHSPTSFLDLELYLPKPPVFEGLAPPVAHPADVVYNNQFRLVGYDIGQSLTPSSAIPITLYWQVLQKPQAHYKYIMQLNEQVDATVRPIGAPTEQEPYRGGIDTTLWDPGKTIIEYTQLPPASITAAEPGHYQLTLQMYQADTLEKLPVAVHDQTSQQIDPQTVALPFYPSTAP